MDDIGFGVSETFGGEVHTPTFSRLAAEGIRCNCFHTTSNCSPTRASLLTGRNHTRVGSGTIAERADLGATVSPAYSERRPFEFGGTIERMEVRLD